MTKVQSFLEFFNIPIAFYKTIGAEFYNEHHTINKRRRIFYKIIFYAGFLNFNFFVLSEIIYFVKALNSFSTILEATAVAPCIGFSFVADFKQLALSYNKRTMHTLLQELEELFPATARAQHKYKLQQYECVMRRVMIVFSTLCLAYTTIFTCYPVCKSAVMYYFLDAPEFERNFGFLLWFPYNATDNVCVYWLTIMFMTQGAYLAGVVFFTADLLLVGTVTQLCMHFNYISQSLLEFERDVVHDRRNIQFLHELVMYHSKCLNLSEHVNQIFSFSLLLNFLTASLSICFIGFQVTASTMENIVMYCIFLLVSLLQVFIVCYYGDELMTASMQVGEAAYSSNWFDCSLEYKRIMITIITRSQRMASIRAPTFPPISFNTYMKVLTMSYQFFALLRTTYYDN